MSENTIGAEQEYDSNEKIEEYHGVLAWNRSIPKTDSEYGHLPEFSWTPMYHETVRPSELYLGTPDMLSELIDNG